MAILQRSASCVVAVVINAITLLAPAFLLRHGHRPLAAIVSTVLCLSIAVAAETACAPQAAPQPADDLSLLNWAQGLWLLTGFELAVVWRSLHAVPSGVIWPIAGSAVILAGAALRCLAIRCLGAGFSNGASPVTQALCVDGIYGWLRHPAETGLILICVGFPIALHAWSVMLITLPVMLLLSLTRLRTEDRVLARTFPGTVQAYHRKVRV